MAKAGKGIRTRQYNPRWASRSRDLHRFFVMGQEAFRAGKKRVPAHDSEVMKALPSVQGRPRGASQALEHWLRGWDNENLKPNPRVELVKLKTPSGRPIRKATKVIFEDGRSVQFLDRFTSKSKAIAQAREALKKNPGATNLAQYVQAALDHSRGSHDAGGKVIHETPKAKRREFAREIWFRRGYRNPPADIMPEFRAGKLRSSRGRLVRKKSEAKAILLSELRRAGRIPARSNPDGGAAADAAYKEFHGRGPDRRKHYDVASIDPYNDHPDLWQLGQLKSLTVGEFIEEMKGREGEQPRSTDPNAWAVTLEFDNNAPDLAGEPGGRQLFIVGGDQNADRYLSDMRVDPGKETVDCGNVYRIEYFTRKGFDKFAPVNYWHHFGEETGVQPRLIYDRTNHRLQLAGGEYVVKREGIVN